MQVNPTQIYFDDVVRRAVTADVVTTEVWPDAKPNRCHENCEQFVRRTSGYEVVRGWFVSGGHWLMPHSVVRRLSTGVLIDITPHTDQFPFVEHLRSEADFVILRQGRDGGWLHPQPPAPGPFEEAQFLPGPQE